MADAYDPRFSPNKETGEFTAQDIEDVGTQTGDGSSSTLRLYRDRVVIGGTARGAIADVVNSAPGATDYGMVVHVATGGGGGTQYTEADTDSTITGTVLMMEDTSDTIRAVTGNVANGLDVDVTRIQGTVTVDGSAVTQPVSGTVTANLSATDNAVLDAIEVDTTTIAGAVSGSEMQVDIVSDGARLATSANQPAVYTDDTSTHSTGSSEGNLLMAAATPTDASVDANDIAAVAMSTDRRLHVDAQIVGTDVALDVSGATVTVTDDGSFTLAANSGIDIGDVDILSIIPGVGATNLGKAEDAAHTSGDTGVMMLAVRQDSQVDFGADGDYVPLRVDANGDLAVAAFLVCNLPHECHGTIPGIRGRLREDLRRRRLVKTRAALR